MGAAGLSDIKATSRLHAEGGELRSLCACPIGHALCLNDVTNRVFACNDKGFGKIFFLPRVTCARSLPACCKTQAGRDLGQIQSIQLSTQQGNLLMSRLQVGKAALD